MFTGESRREDTAVQLGFTDGLERGTLCGALDGEWSGVKREVGLAEPPFPPFPFETSSLFSSL
jgi:hypothetical protein